MVFVNSLHFARLRVEPFLDVARDLGSPGVPRGALGVDSGEAIRFPAFEPTRLASSAGGQRTTCMSPQPCCSQYSAAPTAVTGTTSRSTAAFSASSDRLLARRGMGETVICRRGNDCSSTARHASTAKKDTSRTVISCWGDMEDAVTGMSENQTQSPGQNNSCVRSYAQLQYCI